MKKVVLLVFGILLLTSCGSESKQEENLSLVYEINATEKDKLGTVGDNGGSGSGDEGGGSPGWE